MSVSVLSAEGLDTFLSEVERSCELLAVTPICRARQTLETVPLRAACEALLGLRLGGLRLRYRRLDRVWEDTIRPTLDGFRLSHRTVAV